MTEAKSPREIAERLKQLYDECMKRTPNAMHVFAEYRQMYPLIKAEIDRLATLCGLHWRTIQDANARADKAESYAAERERLLASLIEAAAGVSVLGVIPMEGQHISNDEADERQEKLRTALSRLSSRPATEGK